jgi:type II secretory pathway pseudopilin PulG
MPLADPFFHRIRRLVGDEAGFSLIEALFATVLFAVVSAALMGVLSSATAADRLARQKTIAQQAAQAQVEWIRSLTYDKVGITPVGNPTGIVPATRAISPVGLKANVVTDIRYVNHDGTPTSYATGAFYKRVTVTVTRASDAKQLASEITFIAPPNRAPLGGIDQAVINAKIVDYFPNTAMANAAVDLFHVSPTVPVAEGVTDASGSTSFSALDGSATSAPYDLKVSVPGYQTLADDAPPKTPSHVTLNPSQTYDTLIRIYKPATLFLQLKDAAGAAFSGTANVTMSSAVRNRSTTFAFTNGNPAVTTLGGEPLVPDNYTISAVATAGCLSADPFPQAVPTVQDYQNNVLTATAVLTFDTPDKVPATVQVLNSSNQVVGGATVTITGGPVPGCDVSGTTASTGTIGQVALNVPSGGGYTVTATFGTKTKTLTGVTLPPATSPLTLKLP